MILYEENLKQFKIKNKKDLLNFFIFCYEYSFIPKEFINEIKKDIESVDLPFLYLWLYIDFKHSLYELNYYPYEFLKNSINQSIKELYSMAENKKDFDEVACYFMNQIDIMDLALESLEIRTLIERPSLKLMFADEEDKIYQVFIKYQKQLGDILEKRKNYFSITKFNRDRTLKRKDLELFQEQIIDYLEVWILYLLIIYRENETYEDAISQIYINIQSFFELYFKSMKKEVKNPFLEDLEKISKSILEELYLLENS